MPTYEYRCKDCGEHLEVVQSFQDDALTECPACGGSLRKVFGSIGISFKGSGFYKTDSRSGSKGSSGSSASAGKTDKADSGSATERGDTSSSSKDSSKGSSSDSSSSSSSSGSQAKSA